MGTSIEQATSALINNLHQVFEEPDKTKRDQHIERIWSNSSEAIFVDPDQVCRGHEEISRCVDGLQAKFAGWVFKELGPVLVHPEGGESDLRVARVKWGYGPADSEPKVYGEDVATIVNGKMKMLVAIIEPPQ